VSLFVEDNIWIFIIMTLIFGGGAAFLTGRGLASRWRPMWMAVLAMLPLTAGMRFLHFALFEANLLSFHYFLSDFIVMLAGSLLGYRWTLARKMVQQYPWLYEPSWPLGWKPRS